MIPIPARSPAPAHTPVSAPAPVPVHSPSPNPTPAPAPAPALPLLLLLFLLLFPLLLLLLLVFLFLLLFLFTLLFLLVAAAAPVPASVHIAASSLAPPAALLVIHNKIQYLDNKEQPRSVENIYLETLFVTKPYESSPPPQRLGQISGGPYVECFCYDIDFGFFLDPFSFAHSI